MDFVETEGENIDDAIENALKLLGVGRDKITVDIIAEGRKGNPGLWCAEGAGPGSAENTAATRPDVRAGSGDERAGGF
jgi:predicted RNA-binding protein Jag